ncbi:MAG: acetyltransferase, family [Alphaproteobacteria bacterium]|nr:acetyltransferase, family [Alphaproteobacteria bacterium]
MAGPTIETERLILRPPLAEDLDGWAALMGDEVAARFIGGLQPRAGAWRSLAAMAGSWTLNGFGMFSVIEKATGGWIGRLGPWRPEGWPGSEIAWGLVRPAWGKGYATEGAAAAADWAVTELGWDDLIHCIAPANVASARVAERLGSARRGPGRLPPPFEAAEIDIWGQSADEWRRGLGSGWTLR